MSRNRITLMGAAAALVLAFGSSAFAQPVLEDPMVGGAAMYATKNIVENASNAGNLTTLVAAVKAAGLVATLQGPGPFTVFAPDNAAFDKLPPGTVNSLLQPGNNAELIKILSYHVISGRLTANDIVAQINAGGGRAVLTTTTNEPLTATIVNGALILTDVHGGTSMVTIPNVYQSNGVVHVVNTVLLP